MRNSVVACNAAEVAHKIASTQQIGKHISKGFLGYITASLDMQNMEECSNVEAVVAELQSQSDELANRKLVMIDDYDILTTRYSAVFENLDRELVQRIHMLMEPCFRFVESSRRKRRSYGSLPSGSVLHFSAKAPVSVRPTNGLIRVVLQVEFIQSAVRANPQLRSLSWAKLHI